MMSAPAGELIDALSPELQHSITENFTRSARRQEDYLQAQFAAVIEKFTEVNRTTQVDFHQLISLLTDKLNNQSKALFDHEEKCISNLNTQLQRFQERPDEFEQLCAGFDSGNKVMVITGARGYGKTELARYYGLKNERSVTWLLDVSKPETLLKSYATLYFHLTGIQKDSDNLKELDLLRDMVRKSLESAEVVSWLLIFDGLDLLAPSSSTAMLIERWITGRISDKGEIIVTALSAGATNHFLPETHMLTLDVYSQEHGVNYVQKILRLSSHEEQLAEELCQLVGYHPLALAQLVSLAQTNHRPLSSFIPHLKSQLVDNLSSKVPFDVSYRFTVADVVRQSMTSLAALPNGQMCKQLLEFMASFGAMDISEKVLEDYLIFIANRLKFQYDEFMISDVLSACEKFCLVVVDRSKGKNPPVRMHILTAEFLRGTSTDQTDQNSSPPLALSFLQQYKRSACSDSDPIPFSFQSSIFPLYVAFVETFQKYLPSACDNEFWGLFAKLCKALGACYRSFEQYDRSIEYYKLCESLYKRLTPSSKNTERLCRIWEGLARVYRITGNVTESTKYTTLQLEAGKSAMRALKGQRQSAQLAASAGKYQEAIKTFSECIARLQSSSVVNTTMLDDILFQQSTIFWHLASAYSSQLLWPDAIRHFELCRLFRWGRASWAHAITVKNYLADIFAKLGQFERAATLYREVNEELQPLAVLIKSQPQEQRALGWEISTVTDYIASFYNLALVQLQLGAVEQAKNYLSMGSEFERDVIDKLNAENFFNSKLQYNHCAASICIARGDLLQAEQLLAKNWEDIVSRKPPSAEKKRECLHQLATVHEKQKNFQSALDDYTQIRELWESNEFQRTLLDVSIARVRFQLNSLDKSVDDTLKTAFDMIQRKFGFNHPTIHDILQLRQQMYQARGSESDELLSECNNMLSQITLETLKDYTVTPDYLSLAKNALSLNDFEEAIKFCQEGLEMADNLLLSSPYCSSKDHPHRFLMYKLLCQIHLTQYETSNGELRQHALIEARQCANESLRLSELLFGEQHPEYGQACRERARVAIIDCDSTIAGVWLEKCQSVFESAREMDIKLGADEEAKLHLAFEELRQLEALNDSDLT